MLYNEIILYKLRNFTLGSVPVNEDLMKDGVYVNLHNDVGNLIVVSGGKLEDGEAVSLYDYSVNYKMKGKNTIVFTFDELEYLGEL